MIRMQCDKCRKIMDGADQAAHRRIVTMFHDQEASAVELCPDCYREYQGMVDTFLSEGQDWASLWGTTTITIENDGRQTRIDDSLQPWNREGGE